MSDIAIKVENLGKLYRLGEVGTGTLTQDLKRWWALTRGKEDPFAKVGETNDRTSKGDSDYVWALKDVSFDVKQGEVLGIIGRNGAGKSTLLKLLSKVTTPSTGKVKVRGRVASLLEVGTGFHPDLTGRENIFLNGAILGMTKAEIRSKFDEIVDFAGVERYIDTPVKRYSSGMYVRLAFAVAAFLEPEILIVDEVLAVGDAEFQKKCLGRMKDVSTNYGRTVLFVSHQLNSLANICDNGIVFSNGKISDSGDINQMISTYLKESFIQGSNNNILLSYEDGQDIWLKDKHLYIEFRFPPKFNECYIDITFYDINGVRMFSFHGTRNNAVKLKDIKRLVIKNPGIVNTSLNVDIGLKNDVYESYVLIERSVLLIETEFQEDSEIISGYINPEYVIEK